MTDDWADALAALVVGTPTLFDVDGEGFAPPRLLLQHVERRADDVLWLRYRVEEG